MKGGREGKGGCVMHGHAGEGAQLLFKEELECGEASDQPKTA